MQGVSEAQALSQAKEFLEEIGNVYFYENLFYDFPRLVRLSHLAFIFVSPAHPSNS